MERNTVTISYANAPDRKVCHIYDSSALLAAKDVLAMRYSGVTRVVCTDSFGRVVLDQPVK